MAEEGKEIGQDFGKEQPKITWPEMNDLIQPGKDGQKDINDPWVFNVVKTLSTGSQNRLNEENLQNWLNIGDQKFVNGEIPEEEWGKAGGLIDKKLTEKREKRPSKEFKEENFKKKERAASDVEASSIGRMADELNGFKKDKLTSEEVKALREKQQQVWEKMQEFSGEGFMQGAEKPPDPKNGIEELKNWFSKRIQALIHEYPDQSFETNWTLVWPLQQAISKLWPKEGENDTFLAPVDLKDMKGQPLKDPQGNILREMKPYSYAALRRELAFELEAFRNIHNFRFIYRRVSGVGDVIGASGFLETRYIEYLLHNKEIADSLRGLEELGNKYKNSGDKLDKLKIKDDMEQAVDQNWQGKVASALYSALGRSWRHDITLNESGDFFCGRLFNMPAWAKRRWEKDWGRDPFPELYDALGLGVDDFWNEAFKKLSTEELKSLGIKYTYNDKTGIIEYSFKSAKFEKLNFKELQLKNDKFGNDHLRQVVLDLENADHIRKKILDPKGLLDDPGLQHIDGMDEELKYLKGKKKSDWMEEVMRQIILYFKDQVAPGIDNFPDWLRRCRAQKINADVKGWTNRRIVAAVNGLTPPLTEKDKEELLTEVVGPKFLRGLKAGSKGTVSVIFGAAKGFFGEFFKYLFGGK